MENKFEWDDSTVKEFVRWNFDREPHNYLSAAIEQFKKSKTVLNRDWEILSYRMGNFIMDSDTAKLNGGHKDIYSVKRLSDNCVFSIGDEVEALLWGKQVIKGFLINIDGDMVVEFESCRNPLSKIKKVEKPKPLLFVSEDGVNIYNGDDIWIWDKNAKEEKVWKSEAHDNTGKWFDKDRRKYFSTKEAAEDFILMRSEILSLEDLLSVWNKDSEFPQKREVIENCLLFQNFKELAKTKLNAK